MLSLLKGLNRGVVAVETVLAAGLVLGVFVVVLLQVVMRYVFARSNPWSEELSRFFFIWLSMLGASMAVEQRSHFVFDQIIARLGGKSRRWADVGQMGLVMLAALGLTILGIVLLVLASGQRSAALNLPMVWVYASVPTAGILMLLHLAGALEKTQPQPSATERTGDGPFAS